MIRELPRFLLTVFIMVLLGYAALEHYSPGIEETIKAVVLIAVGYWLGSSKGSADKTIELARQAGGGPTPPDAAAAAQQTADAAVDEADRIEQRAER